MDHEAKWICPMGCLLMISEIYQSTHTHTHTSITSDLKYAALVTSSAVGGSTVTGSVWPRGIPGGLGSKIYMIFGT